MNASAPAPPDPTDAASTVPSQHLTIEALQRPLESARYTSFRYTQRLADLGIAASVGSVADAYDNAMAESFVGTLKTELIAGRVFTTTFDVELAVVEYLGWFNHSRLHESLGDIPPAEFEALYAPQFETITTPTMTKETN